MKIPPNLKMRMSSPRKRGSILFRLDSRFRGDDQQSFTLIELILGFSIFALIGITLYAVFSNGVRINSRADQSEQIYREMRWSLDNLTLDLENMVNYESYRNELGPFRGNEQSLSFALPSDQGLKIIRYSVQPPEQSKIFKTQIGEHTTKNKPIIVNYSEEQKIEFLVREEIPFFVAAGSDTEQPGEPDVLSTHIEPGSLRFSYGYQEKNNGQTGEIAWKNEWADVHYPAAVRVEMNLVDPDNPGEPLIVRKDIFVPAGSWGPGTALPK